MMSGADKKAAISLHSAQAPLFEDRYQALVKQPYSSCFAYSRHRLHSLFEQLVPPGHGKSALDVGCGTGHQVSELGDRGYDVSGVDGSDEMLVVARKLNPGTKFQRADVESLPYDTSRFDLCLSLEVLRYLPDSQPAISELARVLKPGGEALVTAIPTWNLNGYWLVNRVAGALKPGGLVTLKQYFTTVGELQRQFGRAGFATVDIHAVYLGPINWVERLMPSLLPWALERWERVDQRLVRWGPLRNLSNMLLVRARL